MYNCKAYTWKTDSRQCWLKSSVSGKKWDRLSESGTCFGSTTTRTTTPPSDCTGPDQGLDRSRNVNIAPMGNNNIKYSAYDCKQQCESMYNCKAYTWKTDSRQCWLKSSVSGKKWDRLSESGTCFGSTTTRTTTPPSDCTGPEQGLDWSRNVNIAPMGNN